MQAQRTPLKALKLSIKHKHWQSNTLQCRVSTLDYEEQRTVPLIRSSVTTVCEIMASKSTLHVASLSHKFKRVSVALQSKGDRCRQVSATFGSSYPAISCDSLKVGVSLCSKCLQHLCSKAGKLKMAFSDISSPFMTRIQHRLSTGSFAAV